MWIKLHIVLVLISDNLNFNGYKLYFKTKCSVVQPIVSFICIDLYDFQNRILLLSFGEDSNEGKNRRS